MYVDYHAVPFISSKDFEALDPITDQFPQQKYVHDNCWRQLSYRIKYQD